MGLAKSRQAGQPRGLADAQLTMTTKAHQLDGMLTTTIQQHQIRLDVTIPQASQITAQRVVAVAFGQWLTLTQRYAAPPPIPV